MNPLPAIQTTHSGWSSDFLKEIFTHDPLGSSSNTYSPRATADPPSSPSLESDHTMSFDTTEQSLPTSQPRRSNRVKTLPA